MTVVRSTMSAIGIVMRSIKKTHNLKRFKLWSINDPRHGSSRNANRIVKIRVLAATISVQIKLDIPIARFDIRIDIESRYPSNILVLDIYREC